VGSPQNIINRSPITTDNAATVTNEQHLFDYQRFIVSEAVKRQRYAIFADCGLGKTAMFLAWIKRVLPALGDKKVLIVSPNMVVPQTRSEEIKFYGVSTIEDIRSRSVEEWVKTGASQVAVTNFEKFHSKIDLHGNVAAIVLDESSILKNGDGKTRTALIESTRGIPWKLACSATPAPNDREEYASHAAFLEYVRSNNEFYSMFFVNRDNGWEIKPHGLEAFYQYLSTWSIFLRSPENYGFKDNLSKLPKPIFETVNLEWTTEQKECLHQLHGSAIDKKHFLIMLSKGFTKSTDGKIVEVDNNKLNTIQEILLAEEKPTVIWVTYNYEQQMIFDCLKDVYNVAVISGETAEDERVKIIEDFRAGKYEVLISKPKLLGFGLNLPFVTCQIFSGLTDSYEQFYQCVRRSHRFGATESVKVYLPVTAAEKRILSNVLRKKETFEADSTKQESDFIHNLQGNLNHFFNLPYKETAATNSNVETYREGRDWKL
jgi:superfamily II DNA or RNA helicase